MHILTPRFLDPLKEKNVPVINLHPALPGKYDGKDAIKRAYDDYHKGKLEHDTTGIMIHYVRNPGYCIPFFSTPSHCYIIPVGALSDVPILIFSYNV